MKVIIASLLVQALAVLAAPKYDAMTPWTYGAGESLWPKIEECCMDGDRQSPVNFVSDAYMAQGKPYFQWSEKFRGPVTLKNDGKCVEIKFDKTLPGLAATFPDKTYSSLSAVDIHSPSEHHVKSKWSDVELQFMFTNKKGKKVKAVSLLLDVGKEENKWLAKFLKKGKVPKKGKTIKCGSKNDVYNNDKFSKMLAQLDYYSYLGSETAPPCTENVEWFVAKKCLSISLAQLEMLKEVTVFNARNSRADL
ncbi:hypothetical protein HDU77_009145 [Chytriomyces hyalinus]|nr:hypothetical protein HDU77_009145 [Chytriomyces hyalinus]